MVYCLYTTAHICISLNSFWLNCHLYYASITILLFCFSSLNELFIIYDWQYSLYYTFMSMVIYHNAHTFTHTHCLSYTHTQAQKHLSSIKLNLIFKNCNYHYKIPHMIHINVLYIEYVYNLFLKICVSNKYGTIKMMDMLIDGNIW